MVIVMKPGVSDGDIQKLVVRFQDMGMDVGITNGVGCSILGLVGDTTQVDMGKIALNPNVDRVMRVQEPYKKANRKFHPEPTIIQVGKTQVGEGGMTVIAGPCSVESAEQITGVANAVKVSGAAMLRGGAFKPR
ncbi:MAG: 3-deoxy-7-phosphoheptulonate synthase, partial [Oscillospiraceae bacterium]|nr:3-deoxy-7-phosphoheptulonate synthase [Oscillospiraceae bacterium]